MTLVATVADEAWAQWDRVYPDRPLVPFAMREEWRTRAMEACYGFTYREELVVSLAALMERPERLYIASQHERVLWDIFLAEEINVACQVLGSRILRWVQSASLLLRVLSTLHWIRMVGTPVRTSVEYPQFDMFEPFECILVSSYTAQSIQAELDDRREVNTRARYEQSGVARMLDDRLHVGPYSSLQYHIASFLSPSLTQVELRSPSELRKKQRTS